MILFLRILTLIAAVGAFVVGNVVIGIMAKWTQDLPSTGDLKAYEPPVMTRIHAGDGKLVKEYAYQHRVFVPEEEIPDKLIYAFISAEDKTFFEHEGLDLKGLLRGTLFNAIRGRRMAGGSTITQQVVKNMLVGDDRSAERKIREAFVANRLEKVFTKREILELYMNEIYLGGRYYGVGAAALNYFGKSLKELDLAESALLAAMPQAPGKVNPYRRPEAATQRRNWVLSRMAVNGYVSEEDAAAAQQLPLSTVERLNSDEIRAAGYFVEEVRREILRRAEAGEIESVASEDERIKAKYDAGSLKMRELYQSKDDFVEFMRELSTRSLVQADELAEIMSGRTSCEADGVSERDCGQHLFRQFLELDRPQDVASLDMVMNWRKRLRNYRLLYENGLSVRSTLDSGYQLAAQRSLQLGLETYDRRAGFRGAIGKMELGDGWPARLEEKYGPPSSMPNWSPAVVITSTETKIAVGLPSGAKVDLAEKSVEWIQTSKGVRSGKKGVATGDVIYVTKQPAPNVLVRTIKDKVDVPQDGPWHARQIPHAQGALVAMDPHTGRVLAMAGGFSFQSNQFNRAVQAMRQPGSAFKPIVYAAALDSGWTPARTVLDAPFVVETEIGPWKPANYSAGRYYGESTLRLGIEKSRNLMTARLAQDIGMEKVAEYGRRFGIYPDAPEGLTEAERRARLAPQTFYARSLGAGETTPLKMATAYSMMVNGGKWVEPVLLDRIQNRRGETTFKRDQRTCDGCNAAWEDQPPPVLSDDREQVIDAITAFQSVSMMEGVVRSGTASRVRAVDKHVAGKTGTTNDYVDAWFVGFSPDLVAAVWVGKDTARSLEEKSLGDGESGGRVAAPIFRDFMMKALEDKPNLEFRRPPGVRLVKIDADTGQLPGPRTRRIIEEAFRPGTEPGAEAETSVSSEDIESEFRRIIEEQKRRERMQIDPETGELIDPYATIPSADDGQIGDASYSEGVFNTDGRPATGPDASSNDASPSPVGPGPTPLPKAPVGEETTSPSPFDPLNPAPIPTPTPTPTPVPDQDLDYGFQ